MCPIDNRPVAGPGYFHHASDTTKTATALRATYSPSIGDKITNKFVQGGHLRSAGLTQAVRDIGLTIRSAAIKRKAVKDRAQLDKLGKADEKNPAAETALEQRMAQHEHNLYRIGHKRMISEAALSGELDARVEQLNQASQSRLDSLGYQPLTGLGEVKLEQVQSRYLNDIKDNHRIKVHSEGPPLLAKYVAKRVSASYDNGASGFAQRSRSTLQHALVGIQGAALSVKGAVARELADSKHLDAGGRARMDVRATRSEQKRTMLQASLKGNEALNQAYRDVVDEQVKSARARFMPNGDPQQPEYVVRSAQNGIKPPQTRSWERRFSQLNEKHDAEPAAQKLEPQLTGSSTISNVSNVSDVSDVSDVSHVSDAERQEQATAAQRKPGRMARFALAATNLRNKNDLRRAGAESAVTAAKISGFTHPEQRERYDRQLRQNATVMGKAGHNYAVRRSALHGELVKTLQKPEMQSMLEDAFPSESRVHDDLPWQQPVKPRDET